MLVTEEDRREIQSAFRQSPHYPTLLDLSKRYGADQEDLLEIINQNPRVGAFVDNGAVYTWRHVRQFKYLLQTQGRNEACRIMGIGSEKSYYSFLLKIVEIENTENGGKDTEMAKKIKEVLAKRCKFDDLILELAKQGMTQRAIAAQIGIGKTTVQNAEERLRKKGLLAPSDAKNSEEPENAGVAPCADDDKCAGNKDDNIDTNLKTRVSEKKYTKKKAKKSESNTEVKPSESNAPETADPQSADEKASAALIEKMRRELEPPVYKPFGEHTAEEIVRSAGVLDSQAIPALEAAKQAIEYAKLFGGIKDYSVYCEKNSIQIGLRGEDFFVSVHRDI